MTSVANPLDQVAFRDNLEFKLVDGTGALNPAGPLQQQQQDGNAANGATDATSLATGGAAGGGPRRLEHPEIPRDNKVPSKERPQGHYATPPGRTPLQQHLDYFDVNKDGVIMPWETFLALRFLKFAWEPFNSIIAFWTTLLFHAAFSLSAQRSWLPNPLLPIPTKNAMHTKHGASSGAYDDYGYFIPAKFEAIWSSYDRSRRGRLSLLDVARLVWDKAELGNPFGTFFTAFQWGLTWWLFRDDQGLLRKAEVRGLYDGTAFYRLADRVGNPWYGMAKRRDAIKNQKLG